MKLTSEIKHPKWLFSELWSLRKITLIWTPMNRNQPCYGKIFYVTSSNIIYTFCLLQHDEVQIPTPNKDELLIKVEAASINPCDWKVQKGMLWPLLPRKFPHIPGSFLTFFVTSFIWKRFKCYELKPLQSFSGASTRGHIFQI